MEAVCSIPSALLQGSIGRLERRDTTLSSIGSNQEIELETRVVGYERTVSRQRDSLVKAQHDPPGYPDAIIGYRGLYGFVAPPRADPSPELEFPSRRAKARRSGRIEIGARIMALSMKILTKVFPPRFTGGIPGKQDARHRKRLLQRCANERNSGSS